MKGMKKLASFVLALVMVLSMTTTAFAAMEGQLNGGSITINDAVPGQTYNAYQILYLESYNPGKPNEDGTVTGAAYSYKANSAWGDWLKTQTAYVKFDDQGYVTWVDGADAAAFAELAQAQLAGKAVDAAAVASEVAEGETYSTVTLENLKLGYYLVDTTLGTLCSLDTTNPNVTMEEKNEAPTVTKEVQEDSTSEWGETNDADINQVVNYKATITVQTGAENYILHDTMSEGLTYTGVTSVKIGDNAVGAENYTVTKTGTCGCTFEVEFNNTYIATLPAGTQIEVEYSAKLNENAVVGLPGNANEIKLQYGDENKPSYTPVDKTITYTWDTKVIKYTTKDKKEILLSGAIFKLSTDEAGNTVLKFHNLGENKYEVCADIACTKEHVTEITTDSTGTFLIEGLDAGTYYLTETKAPDGYNKLATPVTVTITGATTGEDGKLTYTTLENKVENKTGAELPSTGGMGTTLFYVVGGILVVAALVLLVTKKRMSVEK